jgi:hypothetical protein
VARASCPRRTSPGMAMPQRATRPRYARPDRANHHRILRGAGDMIRRLPISDFSSAFLRILFVTKPVFLQNTCQIDVNVCFFAGHCVHVSCVFIHILALIVIFLTSFLWSPPAARTRLRCLISAKTFTSCGLELSRTLCDSWTGDMKNPFPGEGRRGAGESRPTSLYKVYQSPAMLSSEFWRNFLPAGKDFTIPAPNFLPAGIPFLEWPKRGNTGTLACAATRATHQPGRRQECLLLALGAVFLAPRQMCGMAVHDQVALPRPLDDS